MNSKERVLTALAHKEPDRVPVGEVGIDHDVIEKALGRKVYWRNKAEITRMLWQGERDKLIEGFKRDLRALINVFDYDLVPVFLVPPAGFQSKPVQEIAPQKWKDAEGNIWQYSPGNDSIFLVSRPERSFGSAEELENYFESVLVPRFGFVITGKQGGDYSFRLDDESRLELVRFAKQEFGNDKFVFGRGFGCDAGNVEPLELSGFEVLSEFFGGTGEDIFIHIAMNPDLIKKAIDLYAQIHMAMADVFAKEGIDAVVTGADFSSEHGPMIAPETIRNLFFPAMKREVAHMHEKGLKAITHNCGNNWKILDILIDAGYDCLQSIQRTATMDLGKLKERYGNDISLWGGIEIESLHKKTPERAEKDVLYALKHAVPQGGFIIGSCSTVSYGCSYYNYRAALDICRKYGRYPIAEEVFGFDYVNK